MGKDYEDLMKKITGSFKIHEVNQSSMARFVPPNADIEKAIKQMQRDREEQIQREKDLVEFTGGLISKREPGNTAAYPNICTKFWCNQ